MGGTFGGAIDAFTNHQWRLIMLEYISKKYINLYQRSDSIRPFKFQILNSLKNNLPKLIIMASVLL
jgi:hypothetical protein